MSLRRRIGSKPRYRPLRAAYNKGVREILEQEDALWLEMARKELGISQELVDKPTFSTSSLAMDMVRVGVPIPKAIIIHSDYGEQLMKELRDEQRTRAA